jgi:hypothetical protein
MNMSIEALQDRSADFRGLFAGMDFRIVLHAGILNKPVQWLARDRFKKFCNEISGSGAKVYGKDYRY